ncbi:MAG: leucine--tRNA ligase [candidate division WOR-3 bacterium]|nr:MAG: leucine--tRNA ligase [candidate division WOR-3 bacterium]
MQFKHSEIESKWQRYWKERGLFKAADDPKKKFYNLVMFAYPSGDIHMGHCKNYVIGDVYTRFKMREGFDVLHPFGWDAFGLPAENQAIKMGIHPEKWTLENIRTSDESLRLLGIGYDWEREIITCLPDYYRWTQWMFTLLYKRGLAYKKEAYVNWCPGCQTVLANEQVIDGACYRSNCRSLVEKRKLNQWFFRITKYADRLLKDLDGLDGWPDSVKVMQRNWIGKSEGCDIAFEIADRKLHFKVFTTRPDTIYGVTFLSVAPEHPSIDELVRGSACESEVRQYVLQATKRSDRERIEKEKDGVPTGCFAINPINGEKVPIFVADYVLLEYGSGVVMGVPAHDARDFQFAKKYGLPIKVVINPPGEALDAESMTEAYEDPGIMVDSAEFTGLESGEGMKAVARSLSQKDLGGPSVHYRLKDWLISRQRYWGAPIPIVYCEKCGMSPVPDEELPVLLPKNITDFIPKGRSPLAAVESFINTKCPECGEKATRDPDTMDTFVCSSWYFLRYIDAHNEREFCAKDKADRWLPIDQYIGGGSEHATGHLIYFRFFSKVLHDAGYISTDEPAVNLFNLGMVLKDGEVMSKSKGNAVPVGQFVGKHGADVARLAILFAAPPEREMEWTDEGVTGAERFLNRLYRLVTDNVVVIADKRPEVISNDNESLYIKINQTISKVTADLRSFKYNTAIAALWELLNALYGTRVRDHVFGYGIHAMIHMLSPFAPHIADELWSMVGGKGSLVEQPWIEQDDRYMRSKSGTIVIQINGRVRSHLEVSRSMAEDEVKKLAFDDERVNRHLEGKDIKKTIYVPDKLLNIVVQ